MLKYDTEQIEMMYEQPTRRSLSRIMKLHATLATYNFIYLFRDFMIHGRGADRSSVNDAMRHSD